AAVAAGARPERALHARRRVREPLLRGRGGQGRRGRRRRADRRLLHHRPAGPGAGQGGDAGRRARRRARRPRADGAAAQAGELPRTAPATGLRPPDAAGDREGAEPMSAGVDIVVRGGQVVTGSDVVDAAVAIRGDTTVATGPEWLLPPAGRGIDAS